MTKTLEIQPLFAHMSTVQWGIFLCALDKIVDGKYGTVTLEVKDGVVRRVVSSTSIELPDPKDDIHDRTEKS